MKIRDLERLSVPEAKAYIDGLYEKISEDDSSLIILVGLMCELDDLKSRQITGENDGKI